MARGRARATARGRPGRQIRPKAAKARATIEVFGERYDALAAGTQQRLAAAQLARKAAEEKLEAARAEIAEIDGRVHVTDGPWQVVPLRKGRGANAARP